MTHHVIYVPGLGDSKSQAQPLAPAFWSLFGVCGHYMALHWNKGAFGPKQERLLDAIDELSASGDIVSLVGTSAGASAVLLAYGQRLDKVAGVALICGKVNHPEAIGDKIYADNPAFRQSMYELQKLLPSLSSKARARILSIHPVADGTVPPAHTKISGAHEAVIPTAGHAASILFALIFYAPFMLAFLKRQARIRL